MRTSLSCFSPMVKNQLKRQMVSTDNLYAYYKLNETSDGSASVSRVDSSGNGRTLTDNDGNGGKVYCASTTGKIENAAVITATNNGCYLTHNVASPAELNLNQFTVSGWVYTEDTTDITCGCFAICYGLYTSIIKCDIQTTDVIRWRVDVESSGSYVYCNSYAPVSFGEWQHLALVFTGAGSSFTATAYKNAVPGTPVEFTEPLKSNLNTYQRIYIGRQPSDTSHRRLQHIDEVGFWNRALSVDEITALYNSGAGLSYPFKK